MSGKVGWSLKVSIGLSRTKGFYINTVDPDNPTDKIEFEVGANLKLDRAGSQTAQDQVTDLTAQLAIIEVNVEKRTDRPSSSGTSASTSRTPPPTGTTSSSSPRWPA